MPRLLPTAGIDAFWCEAGGYEIPSSFVCDGYPDCQDGADELNCGEMRANGTNRAGLSKRGAPGTIEARGPFEY